LDDEDLDVDPEDLDEELLKEVPADLPDRLDDVTEDLPAGGEDDLLT
jgi:hypothetical protein